VETCEERCAPNTFWALTPLPGLDPALVALAGPPAADAATTTVDATAATTHAPAVSAVPVPDHLSLPALPAVAATPTPASGPAPASPAAPAAPFSAGSDDALAELAAAVSTFHPHTPDPAAAGPTAGASTGGGVPAAPVTGTVAAPPAHPAAATTAAGGASASLATLAGLGRATTPAAAKGPPAAPGQGITTASTPAAADPELFIPQNLTGTPGATVTVPVQMKVTESTGISVSEVDVAFAYDTSLFTVSNPRLGSLLPASTFDVTLFDTTSFPGEVILSAASSVSSVSLPANDLGSVFLVDFTVKSGAPNTASPVNLQAEYDSGGMPVITTAVYDNNLMPLTLNPAPTNASNDAVDGIFTVTGAANSATTTTVAAAPNPSVFGQSVTFTATVTGTGGTPTGTVTFKDGSTTLGTGTLSGGTTTFSTAALAVGSHSITAVYGGDSTFLGSTSSALSDKVNKASSTTTLASSLNPSEPRQSVTFTATVAAKAPGAGTPTGSVTFKDGSTTLATVALSNGAASFTTSALAAGNHPITASYAGNGNFNGSSGSLTQTVGPTTTTVTAGPNPAVFGQPVTLSATVTAADGGTPTGTVTFKSGSTVLGTGTLSGGTASLTATPPVGKDSITAVYGGDSNYAGSTSAAFSETVNKASTATALASSLNPSSAGQSVTFTATVSITAPGAGTLTGTVTFKDGSTTLATVALSNGTASFTTSALAGGSHKITASYSGDSHFNSSSASLTQTVGPTTTAVTASPSTAVFGQPVTLTATVTATNGGTPTGTVTFKSGNTVLGTGTLSGGTASLTTAALPVGTDSITAVYGGDANYAGSTSAAFSESVKKASTTTALASSANPSTVGQTVTFTATLSPVAPGAGTPTGTVTFKDGSTTLGTGTLSGGVATFSTSSLTAGPHSITASYGGDSHFNGSTSATLTQQVN
jgi:hypothetical protein